MLRRSRSIELEGAFLAGSGDRFGVPPPSSSILLVLRASVRVSMCTCMCVYLSVCLQELLLPIVLILMSLAFK